MNKKKSLAALAGLSALLLMAGMQASASASYAEPRNVILLVGDGMGVQEITAARYYLGVDTKLNVDDMPYTGFDLTWSVKPAPAPPYLPDYDPDSSSTATTWATGKKTIDGRLSQGPSSARTVPGPNYPTVLELAQRNGRKVGVVSTADVTDATPAALASHISQRGCQGPAEMTDCPSETTAAGGLGSIAEQEVDHEVDVLLGGGRSRFEQTITGGPDADQTVVESARAKGYQYVTDRAALRAIKNSDRPVLGLFSSEDMAVDWSGPAATLGGGTPPAQCSEGHRPASEPSLAEMTSKALSLLKNKRGFFLQVEGALIDEEDHTARACGQLGESAALDAAVGVALEYQKHHRNTLVITTADHSHTSQIVAEDVVGGDLPTGYSTNVITRDGQTMRLTYGTAGYAGPGSPLPSTAPDNMQHTGAMVPVWASGPGGAEILGTNDHTDLYTVLSRAVVATAASQ